MNLNFNFIKKLAKSRTIRGIVGAAVAFLSTNVVPYVPAEVLGTNGPLISLVLQALGLGSLGYAWNGRLKAAGPITSPGPGDRAQGSGYDGTGQELPK